MTQFELNGKVALITGASKGLGKAATLALAAAGASTVAVSRHLKEVEQTTAAVEATGAASMAIEADITDPLQVERMVASAIERFGHIDILVNNAGINLRKPVLDFSVDDWQAILQTNLIAAHTCAKAVCADMIPRRTGSIIHIASILANAVLAERAVYGASKAGLVQLSKFLAIELAPYGIRSNTICPGPFDSEMRQQMSKQVGDTDNLIERIPMSRIGQPEEIGGTVVYLAAEASRYITGVDIPIDGGWSARS